MLTLPRSSLNMKHLFALATSSKKSNKRVAFELFTDSGGREGLLRRAGVLNDFVQIAGLQIDLGLANLLLVVQAIFARAVWKLVEREGLGWWCHPYVGGRSRFLSMERLIERTQLSLSRINTVLSFGAVSTRTMDALCRLGSLERDCWRR
jgi:hypothetical protein